MSRTEIVVGLVGIAFLAAAFYFVDELRSPTTPRAHPAAANVERSESRMEPPRAADQLDTHPPGDDLVVRAEHDYAMEDFVTAKALATEALERDPANTDAVRVLVVVACADNDYDSIRRYFGQLAPEHRQAVGQACSRTGVQIDQVVELVR